MKQLLQLPIIALIFCFSNSIIAQCENNFSNLPSIDNYYRTVPIRAGSLTWEETFFFEGTQKDYFSVFANNLLVGGVSPGGNLHLSWKTYQSSGPGPLNEDGSSFENPCNYFDRLWVISGSDIKIHKQNYEQGILSVENTPKDILEWPAIGNVHFKIGEENGNILDQDLAPFFDTNIDGIYNALDGDLPIYKSGVAFNSFEDVWAPYIFSLNIANDANSSMEFDGAERMNLEFLQSAYLLNCSDNQELNYSVFYSINAIYKGEEVLNDVRFGFWEDSDFGCYDNDLIGCYPPLNTSFVYNANSPEVICNPTNIEPITLAWGMARNTILLSHEMRSFIYFNNENVGNPNPNTVDPGPGFTAFNLLNARWLDGTPLTVGGSGYNPGSADETLFAFPGLPSDASSWSMVSVDLGNGDRRTITGIDTPEILSPGDNVIIDLASQVMFDPFTSHLGIFNSLEENVQAVKDAYNTMNTNPQELDACAASTCTEDCVWPGNIYADDRVDAIDILFFGAISGKGWDSGNDRDQRGGIWAPHNASNWNQELTGQNIKHADCNGDGELTESDSEIFSDNFGFTIPNSDEFQNKIEAYDPEGFKLEFDKTTIDLEGSVIDRFLNINVRPREDGESFDFAYHGVSFDIVFDSSLIVPSPAFGFEINDEYFSETMFADAFYDEIIGDTTFEAFGDNRISVYVTSSSGENEFPSSRVVIEYGMIALENATTGNTNGIDTTELRLENIVFMDADGNILDTDVGYYSDELIISGLQYVPETSSTNEHDLDLSLKVIPNPSSDEITIQSRGSESGELSIINLDGNIVDRFDYSGSHKRMYDVSQYHAGVYVLQLKNTKGQVIGLEKLIIVK